MEPATPLPFDRSFAAVDDYIHALFDFAASHELFKALCGGVHILGFFTVQPPIYSSFLPQEWRRWFDLHDVASILDLLLREDVAVLERMRDSSQDAGSSSSWREFEAPPASLLDFVLSVRQLSLKRVPSSGSLDKLSVSLPHSAIVGMKPKKIHETQLFARYVSELQAYISQHSNHEISHVVDFGSGQNYLGRTLAADPYNQRIIALERKQHNIGGAQIKDVRAKLVEKPKRIVNKKAFRQHVRLTRVPTNAQTDVVSHTPMVGSLPFASSAVAQAVEPVNSPIVYVERDIENGDLSFLTSSIQSDERHSPQYLVISLHSCGDLLHHGLRSLVSNDAVKAVAMVGCCYHLNSDRLGPPTWKPPFSRQQQDCSDEAVHLGNPNGFPLSERMLTYRHRNGRGIRLNITARMMGSQAAANWTDQDCGLFFQRHFYRALLQKIFLDFGLLDQVNDRSTAVPGPPPKDDDNADVPITIGSLRKSCYISFTAYVRGAMRKLEDDQSMGRHVKNLLQSLTDEQIVAYETRFAAQKRELSIMWSLMSFAASVTESIILTDRYLYLSEQSKVDRCWVQPIFDYRQSPRNLVVVGIKK